MAINHHLLAVESEDILLPSSKKQNLEETQTKSETVAIFPMVEFTDLEVSRVRTLTDDIKRNLREYYPQYQAIDWQLQSTVKQELASRNILESALSDAANEMRDFKWESAKKKLVLALENYMGKATTRSDFEFALKAREKLVEIYFRLGQVEQAKRQIESILAVDINFVFNPLYFASVWIDEAQAIRSEMKKRPPVSLKFARDIPHSRIYIDGLFVGDAPLVVSSLPSGPHWIRIETPAGVLVQEESYLAEDGKFTPKRLAHLGTATKVDQAILLGSLDPELIKLIRQEAERLSAKKVIFPLAHTREDEVKVDLIALDVSTLRFASLGTIFSKRNASQPDLKPLDKVEWSNEWQMAWINQGVVWSGPEVNVAKEIGFAMQTKSEKNSTASPTESSDTNKRKILTIAPRVAELPPEPSNQITTSNANRSIWFWTAIAGGSALALGASAVAIYFLVPTNTKSSTDFDFTIGSR